MTEGKYLFAEKNDMYYIKLVGALRYDISPGFNKFLNEIFETNHCVDFLIDLTETEYLDSTNLGLIARIARYMNKCGKKARIVSTNEDVNKILCSVGFDEVFILLDKYETVEETLNEIEQVNEEDRAFVKMMLEAHKNLICVSEKNIDKFKGVIELMGKKYNKEASK